MYSFYLGLCFRIPRCSDTLCPPISAIYVSHFQLRSCQPDYEESFQNREMMSEKVINIYSQRARG